jgi:hypothetical protein
VVETIRLESGHTLTGIVGSNPTLSASFFLPTKINNLVMYIADLVLICAFMVPESEGAMSATPVVAIFVRHVRRLQVPRG